MPKAMREAVFGVGADLEASKTRLRLEQERVLNVAVALGNELRLKMLATYWNDGRQSAQMMFRQGLASLNLVAYHNRRLRETGVISEVGRQKRRGATEVYYDLTPFGRACLELASTISAHETDAIGG